MKPRSLSATSLQVARGCLARWKAEFLNKGGGFSGKAANTGSAVHYALEKFVEAVYLTPDSKTPWSDIQALKIFYMKGYVEIFGTADFDTPEYEDGWDLCVKWHKRTDLDSVHQIVSVEQYKTFEIPTSIGPIPFNYIMDRFDILEVDEEGNPTVIRVVDYKTIQLPLNPEDLKKKIQAKAYAVMARIQYPKVQRIWVQFDLLRHDPVGVVFTYEDNVAAYNEIVAEAERIIATPDDEVPETLNMDCRYCVRAGQCDTLNRNIESGSILSMSIEEIAKKKLEIEFKLKGLASFVEKCDEALMKEAVARGEIDFEVGNYEVAITRSRRRDVEDQTKIAEILGPELAARHSKFGVTDLDSLMKSGALTDEQVEQIKGLMYWKRGEPKAKVKEKSSV